MSNNNKFVEEIAALGNKPCFYWHRRNADGSFSSGSAAERLGKHKYFVPFVNPKFHLPFTAPAFTIGSCFARNIERALLKECIEVISTEIKISNDYFRMPDVTNSYILNKFNTHSIYYELYRALENIKLPDNGLLKAGNESWYDPHTSYTAPHPYEEVSETRNMIENLYRRINEADYLIITLGLTEAWLDIETNSFMNALPPVEVNSLYKNRFKFINADFTATYNILKETLQLLYRHCGDRLKVIFTVSPVPLQRTFENSDVVTANMYSKSILRTVAQTLAGEYAHVDYYPSYEMVMYSPPDMAWEKDRLHVKSSLIERVTGYFIESYMVREKKNARFDKPRDIYEEKARAAASALLDASVKRIAFYGAGKHTARILENGWFNAFEITGILDDVPLRNGFGGIKVYAPDTPELPVWDALLISSDRFEEQLFEKCRKYGLSKVVKLYSKDAGRIFVNFPGTDDTSFLNVELNLSRRCNLRCPNCQWILKDKSFFEKGASEMSRNDAFKLLNFLVDAGFRDIHPHAEGEVLMVEYFEDLVKALLKAGCKKPPLITNGILLDKYIDFSLECFSHVTVSLDGFDPLTYRIRRGADAKTFDRIISNISSLVMCKRETGTRIPLIINCIIGAENTEWIASMINLSVRLGVDNLRFGNYHPTGPSETLSPITKKSREALNALKQITSRNDYSLGISLPYPSEVVENFACEMLFQTLNIGPDMTLSPCCRINSANEHGRISVQGGLKEGSGLKEFRRKFRNAGSYSELPLPCRECSRLSALTVNFDPAEGRWRNTAIYEE